MAYRFKVSEPFDDGVRRIGLQQIDRAMTSLESNAAPGIAVHATRKTLKRVRALLRLIRPGLSAQTFTMENARYRDIGRLLSATRDQHVLVETIVKLEGLAAGRTRAAFSALAKRIAPVPANIQATADPEVIADARARLAEGRAAFADLAIKGAGKADRYAIAWGGLERSYAQGLRAMGLAYDSQDAEAFHDWRKRVQHHWRHMSLLTPAWPELFDARIATARQLSALLGEDHDIAMMAHTLAEATGVRVTPMQGKLIAAFARDRQDALRADARVLGLRLYCESPTAFAQCVAHYWSTAAATAHPVLEPSPP